MAKPEAKKKERLTAASVALATTSTTTPAVVKGLKTKFENAHAEYWRAVRSAWKAFAEGEHESLDAAADAFEVEVLDLLEMVNHEEES